MSRTPFALLCMVAMLITGCATSESARKLAERTAANASLLSSEVGRLADQESRIAQLRAQILADYAQGIERSRVAYNLDVALTDKSGDSSALALKRELEQWIDQAATLGRLPSERRAAIVKEIEATQKPITPKVEELNQVAAALAELAKKDEFAGQSEFLAGYASEVARLVKAGESDADAAGETARTSRDGISDSQSERKAP